MLQKLVTGEANKLEQSHPSRLYTAGKSPLLQMSSSYPQNVPPLSGKLIFL
jgi:hypothetical protein